MASGLKSSVHRLAFSAGLSSLLARRQRGMRVLMFHGVLPEEAHRFEEVLRYIARKFSIVPLSRIVNQVLLPGDDAKGTHIALTFDDGLLNNYSVVYPALKRLGVPATFFVCPSLIDSGGWLWNQEMRARLSTLLPAQLKQLVTSLGAPSDQPEGLVEWMKTIAYRARAEAEMKIRQSTPEFRATQAQHEQFDLMGWAHLQALDPNLIGIGSHSDTHPILTSLADAELEREMAESRRRLEQQLQRPVDTFCYPNGIYDARCLRIARNCFRAALTTAVGFINAGDDPYELARIPGTCDASLLAWRLHRPAA
jgi:peptidoglycan/xylan/chitin deacetylase (PgdA/CDA1 family)